MPSRPRLFEAPKVLVQRLRGRGPIRAWVDRGGLYAWAHPDRGRQTPRASGRRLPSSAHHRSTGRWVATHGARLPSRSLPQGCRSIPLPKRWLEDPGNALADAWGLTAEQAARLLEFQVEVIVSITG